MIWQEWDHNIKQLREVSGGCENGTTCIFEQKDGKDFHFTLSNVTQNKSVVITPVDNFSTRIDYSFELSGSIGFVVAVLRKRAVVEGTEVGLKNMVKMSEEAQGSEFVIMN